jgi:hypothetical protein
MRTALLLSSLFATACTVGELPTNHSNPGVDAGGTPGTDGGAAANGCVTRLDLPYGEKHIHLVTAGTGTDNAGQNCVSSGCHLKGATGTVNAVTAPAFRYGGTLYKSDGTTVDGGAVIQLKDTTGKTAMYYTDDGGNFNITDDDQMLAALTGLSFNVSASACPNITLMSSVCPATNPDGCGGTACHATGTAGTTGSGGKLILALDKP